MKKMTDRQTGDAGSVESSSGRPESQLSRRRFTGAGLAAPVILSLASRPAFGAVCTPSGFVSYSPNNPSGVRHEVDGCGGLSPGAWKNPYAGNGDGSFSDWVAAGFLPNDPAQTDNVGAGNNTSRIRQYKRDNPGAYVPTLFTDAFGGYGPTGMSMHDVLLDMPGSLEFHAAATLLNASSGIPGYMSPSAVVNLYIAKVTNGTYSSGGTTIDMSSFDLKAFFEQTYH